MTTIPGANHTAATGAATGAEAVWRTLLDGLVPYARTRIETLFDPEDPPPFLEFAMDAFEKDAVSGRPGLVSAPLLDGPVIRALSSPAILKLPDAMRLARAAVKLDSYLDTKLLNNLTAPHRNWPTGVPDSETTRVLEVLDEISDCRRLVMPLLKFLRLPNPSQRSKVVKLIARASQNPGWAETLLADPDPRIRSNLVEGLMLQSSAQIELLLRRATSDPHHRVATTALLGLCQRGDTASCEQLRAIATEGDGPHRGAAQWALAKLELPAAPASEPAFVLPNMAASDQPGEPRAETEQA